MDTTNNFFPMDLGAMPMQTDMTGMPNEIHSAQQGNGQQQPQTNVYGGSNVFMGVSDEWNDIKSSSADRNRPTLRLVQERAMQWVFCYQSDRISSFIN